MLHRSPESAIVFLASLFVFVLSVIGPPVLALADELASNATAAGGTTQTTARDAPASPSSDQADAPSTAAAYDSEYCEVLNRFNAKKKISDPAARSRVEGQYNQADDVDRLRTWSVETACGEFLVAVPMWADVSPPVLAPKGGNLFEDSMGSTWDFQVGSDGVVTGVTMVSADGTVTELKVWGDPHEKLNSKR